MKTELKEVLERVGWDALYEQWIPNLSPPDRRGERTARSPFPDSHDNNPSFRVNTLNGLWKDYHSDRAGNYVQFVALMEATEFDALGKAVVDNYAAVERKLLVEHGVASLIDQTWVEQCRLTLYHDLTLQANIQRFKPWTREAMWQLQIGFDVESQRYVIPLHDQWNQLINAKLYRPGGEPKMFWKVPHITGNFLFPPQAWRDQQLILVEGETDVISLRSLGFHACSGTMGSGLPIPEGPWARNKHVYIWMDDDPSGNEAQVHAVVELRSVAEQLGKISLPNWEGRPEKPDASDYIRYLESQDFDQEQITRSIVSLVVNAETIDSSSTRFDLEIPVPTNFSNATSSSNLGRYMSFSSHIVARSSTKYTVPTSFRVACPASGHAYCKRCPMNFQFNGRGTFRHEARSSETLKLIQVPEEKRNESLLKEVGIPPQCPDASITIDQAVDAETIILSLTLDEQADQTEQDRQRREAIVILEDHQILQENADYDMTGRVYGHPKSQQLILLIDSCRESEDALRRRIIDPDLLQQAIELFGCRPGSELEKLVDVASDMASSVTKIYDRTDLHLAYRTVWHSILAFNFQGSVHRRGWIEALVVGDTRCGKSQAFQRMAEWYGRGELVDCKLQTPAGVMGAVVQAESGDYYVVPGVLPRNDGSIVCFDEFHTPRWHGQSIMDHLSSTRAEGVVRISKAASAVFQARVRSIWLANPGSGRLLSELGDSGVETIPRLVQQPEDIARFDFAMAVAQDDVNETVINAPRKLTDSTYPRLISRELIRWVHTREADQIIWLNGAETAVLDVATRLCARYNRTIPLVEPSDQRHRVAKVAVSIAAQLASISDDLKSLEVKPNHVLAAEQLFRLWYDKPTLGYDVFSVKAAESDVSINYDEIVAFLESAYTPNAGRVALEILRLDQFNEKTLSSLAPIQIPFVKAVIQNLYLHGCIRLVQRGKVDAYEKTPQFVKLLKKYLKIGE